MGGLGRSKELLCPLWAHQLPSTSLCSTQKLSSPCCLGIFMVISLHRQNWLSHWRLSSVSLPGSLGNAESSNPTSGWFFWWPVLIMKLTRVCQKERMMNNRSSRHSGDGQELGALCWEPGQRPHRVFTLSQEYCCQDKFQLDRRKVDYLWSSLLFWGIKQK